MNQVNGKIKESAQVEQALKAAQATLQKLPLMGPVVWLYTNSPAHKHLFLVDLEWLLMPPLMLNQSKLYMQNEAPLAYLSWAKVSPEVGARLRCGNARLAPHEWNCGDEIWLIDIVAPFGGGEAILQDLQSNLFSGSKVHFLEATKGTEKQNN